MNSIVSVFWNALLTAIVATLLAGLFVAAMPPVYQATAIIKGDSDAMLKIRSGELLQSVVRATRADLSELEGWLEQLMSASTDPVSLLSEKLTVSVGDDPEWVNISVEAQSAEVASTLANELAHMYLERNAKAWLSPEEKARLFVEVEGSNADLLGYLQENPSLMNPLSQKARINTKIKQTESGRLTALNILERFRQQLVSASASEVGALTEPGVVRASQRLDALNLKRAELTARYGSQHLKMAALEAEIKKAQELLDDALEAYEERITPKILELEKQVAKADEELISLNGELELFTNQLLELKRLELAKEAAVKKYEGMTGESRVELVADAVPPRNTFGFNQLMLLGLVFLGTFMLVVVLMVIRSLRAR